MQVPQLHEKRPERIIDAIHLLARGRMNCHGEVTLTPGSPTTTVTHPAIGRDAAVILTPYTLNGAAAMTAVYVSAQDSGTFTLTHSPSGQTDRTFRWVAIGG